MFKTSCGYRFSRVQTSVGSVIWNPDLKLLKYSLTVNYPSYRRISRSATHLYFQHFLFATDVLVPAQSLYMGSSIIYANSLIEDSFEVESTSRSKTSNVYMNFWLHQYQTGLKNGWVLIPVSRWSWDRDRDSQSRPGSGSRSNATLDQAGLLARNFADT